MDVHAYCLVYISILLMSPSFPQASAEDSAAAVSMSIDNEETASEPVKKKPRTSDVGNNKVNVLPPVLANLSAKETKPLLVVETREVKCDHKDENFPVG